MNLFDSFISSAVRDCVDGPPPEEAPHGYRGYCRMTNLIRTDGTYANTIYVGGPLTTEQVDAALSR